MRSSETGSQGDYGNEQSQHARERQIRRDLGTESEQAEVFAKDLGGEEAVVTQAPREETLYEKDLNAGGGTVTAGDTRKRDPIEEIASLTVDYDDFDEIGEEGDGFAQSKQITEEDLDAAFAEALGVSTPIDKSRLNKTEPKQKAAETTTSEPAEAAETVEVREAQETQETVERRENIERGAPETLVKANRTVRTIRTVTHEGVTKVLVEYDRRRRTPLTKEEKTALEKRRKLLKDRSDRDRWIDSDKKVKWGGGAAAAGGIVTGVASVDLFAMTVGGVGAVVAAKGSHELYEAEIELPRVKKKLRRNVTRRLETQNRFTSLSAAQTVAESEFRAARLEDNRRGMRKAQRRAQRANRRLEAIPEEFRRTTK